MAKSLQASQQALDDLVDPARIRKHWNQHDQRWADAARISLKTLQRFWDRELIRRPNFIAICQAIDIEDWEAIADFPPSPPETFVYNPETWVGRDSLLEELLDKLKQQTRLVWLTGISGVGKTTLGECLAAKAWDAINPFDWIAYEIPIASENQNFTVSIAALLETYLGDTDLDSQERNDPKRLSDRLLRKLQSRPYWIQLDSIERLFDPESSAFTDEYWLTFFQHCLTQPEFPSRLVLTSQAFPASMIEWRDRYPNRWYETTLRGLLVTEQQNERLEFFSKNGIPAERLESWLDRIAEIYEGHPLVLRVIAGEIRQNYNGDVAQYWAVNYQEFEQVARERQDQRLDETEYNDVLDRQVRDRVKKSLEQLPSDALDLLCRSAVYRRPVPRKFWLAMIGDSLRDGKAERSPKQQKAAYRVLSDRALVEQEDIHQGHFLIRQHNLIRDIAYDLLHQDPEIREAAEHQAAHQWLTVYEPAPDASNLEKVRGQIEAFHHFCELANWSAAKTILLSQELGTKLQTWGYYREMIVLYSRVMGCLSSSDTIACKRGLGNAYLFLGDCNQAIDSYQQSLDLARKTSDRQAEGKALGNLGTVYHRMGSNRQAIEFHQQHLAIAREVGDQREEGNALGSLGNIYYSLDDYRQAIEFCQQSLDLARKIGDQYGEGYALVSLAASYGELGDYRQAIEFCQQSLDLARKIDDRYGEGVALVNLGLAYSNLGNYEQAIEFYQQRLTIAREIGDRYGEGVTLGNLGIAYDEMGKHEQAIEFYQQRLTIAREIGYRRGEGTVLCNLGTAYESLGHYEQAINFYQQALSIAREIGNRSGEAYALGNLGSILTKLEQYSDALENLQTSLKIFQEIGDRSAKAEVLKNLAKLHQKVGEINLAQEYCNQALELAIELAIPLVKECKELKQKLEEEDNNSEH